MGPRTEPLDHQKDKINEQIRNTDLSIRGQREIECTNQENNVAEENAIMTSIDIIKTTFPCVKQKKRL